MTVPHLPFRATERNRLLHSAITALCCFPSFSVPSHCAIPTNPSASHRDAFPSDLSPFSRSQSIMEPRIQRWLLVLFIFLLSLALYRDFGNDATVRRIAQHAASFTGHRLKEESSHPTSLEPANATLGVSPNNSTSSLSNVHRTKHSQSSLESSSPYPAGNLLAMTACSAPPT